jgi:cytochrome c-type biogenesis protein CcmH
MHRIAMVILLVGLATSKVAFAVQPDEMLRDPVLEARARDLSRELRCMVCQNQSIDDSEAPLARDLRLLVRERLTKGDSDQEVLDFMVARYGEFVLLKPRLEWHTLVLWGLPPAALIAGTFALLSMARRRSKLTRDAEPLSQEEEGRLSALIDPAARDQQSDH